MSSQPTPELESRLEALMRNDPAGALKLIEALQGKVVIPHAGGQQLIVADNTRFKVVCCGRRFGKTVIGGKKAIEKARTKHNQMVWWVAPTYKIVKRGYREVLRQLPDGLLTHVPPQDSAFDAGRSVILKFKNGSRIEFYSAERPEGMLGEGVDLAILDEAAIMGKNVWDQIVRPTLMDRQGQALMISTPRGRNWFYYMWLRGAKSEYPDYAAWKFPTSSNPYISDAEVESMRMELPLIEYEQEVLADFVSNAGAVFRFSTEVVHEEVKPQGHCFVGIDLARSNDFTVITAVRGTDGEPCGFERFNDVAWRLQRNKIKSFVSKLIKNGATAVTLVMDSTGVGDPIAEDMEFDGYDVVPINFTKYKQPMVTQLSKDLEDGIARLNVNEEIPEFENYAYSVTEAGRWTYSAPEGQNDDCVAAKMLAHWGLVQEGTPNVVAIGALDDDEQIERSPLERDPDEDDYSDLLEAIEETERINEEITSEPDMRPDSSLAIMQRSGAWNSFG